MSTQDNNPYAAPQAELSNLPTSEKPELMVVVVVYCQLYGSWHIGTDYHSYAYGHTAMLCGVIVMYFASISSLRGIRKNSSESKKGRSSWLSYSSFRPLSMF